jgi:hypothetical protein
MPGDSGHRICHPDPAGDGCGHAVRQHVAGVGLDGVVSVEQFLAWAVVVGAFTAVLLFLRKRDADRVAAQDHAASEAIRRAQAQRVGAARTTVKRLIAESQAKMSALPPLVTEACTRLEQADHEYRENAYAPFWSAIEAAAIALATYEGYIEDVGRNADEYAKCTAMIRADLPAFDLGERELPSVAAPLERMRYLVRAAQTDFPFATIYEQRKTNQLLVAGFQTLEQAIWQLGDRFDSSLETFSRSLASTISSEFAAQTATLVDATTAQTSTLVGSQNAALARHSAALREEMRAARQIAETESQARQRKDVADGRHFVR